MKEISVSELKAKMDAGDDIQLIDVRMPDEWAVSKIEGAELIPLPNILQRMDELDKTKEIIVYCRMGGRSARAIQALAQAGFEGDMSNMVGGMLAWSAEIDPGNS